ncbi:AfsR/SARP family transcriptional regulator [Paractinoplanes atraurantiacus]|uniref:DNA-binding transcriptional activator of the SARP family n=1 Tax=Paractinoplanes atraurantiacus TaxID=1036182 RepID=A0A285JY52_9ACTN|nr:BTAD domain-containing putative transcriptional regulator [Actinoplanes atraurantiacus]SNY65230.1 DNA-binding transcriptional activator of the SARP family [Actinoplanes atraurantiacus]
MATRFQLLGAVEARAGGRVLELGHRRQCAVLAVLLLEANRPVTAGELVNRVWGGRAPQRDRETLYGYLSRLRGALAPAGDARIIRRASGYVLTVEPEAVDVHRFHRLVASARKIDDCLAALEAYEEALALWRGEALPGLDTPWLNDRRDALDRCRREAGLERNELALRCGRQARVLDEMSAAAAAHPLDERLAGQLMLGLYRAGRQGEALDCYRRLRTRLADEVGVDPGEPLRSLHRRILRADPSLAAPVARRVPSQVPAPPSTFTGRAAELARLSELAPGAVGVIVGPGGVGKTWTARRWAHEHRAGYPDGQLFADLRGFDPAGPPVPAAVVIRRFLDALGVAAASVPADPDAQTALYRSLVAGRRMIIVLDNARDSAHAAPLLPGAAGCAVLVTSRHELVGLVTAHGARPVALGTLGDDEARRLLAGHLGGDRVAAEPAAVRALLRHCAGLPLALGIVAARAAVHPGLPLAELAAELEDAATRLDALDGGELAVNVRAALSCSAEALSEGEARLFALLGSAAGEDAGLDAIASLAGLPAAATRGLLRGLTAAHLVAEPRPGRWHMHDLVRLYAAERPGAAPDRPAARRRLLDHYLRTAYAANRALAPLRDPIDPGPVEAPIPSEARATAWFAAEHANLLAAVAAAHDNGLDTHAWQLAWAMATYLDRHAHWRDQAAVHLTAEAAARRLGDRAAQAYALNGLARAEIWLGRYEQARAHLRSALELLDDPAGRAHLHRALARSHARDGDPRQALAHDEQALALYAEAGHRCGQATALNAIGWHHAHLGEQEQALRFCVRALALHRDNGDRPGAAATLDSLGYIHRRRGRHDEALSCYGQAIELFAEIGDRYEMADTLINLGDTHAAAGDPDRARTAWQLAMSVFEELGVPSASLRSRLRPAGNLSAR